MVLSLGFLFIYVVWGIAAAVQCIPSAPDKFAWYETVLFVLSAPVLICYVGILLFFDWISEFKFNKK